MTKTDLRRIYENGYSQAGDSNYDFYRWAIDYVLDILNNGIRVDVKKLRDLIYEKGNWETLYSQDINVMKIAKTIASNLKGIIKEKKI